MNERELLADCLRRLNRSGVTYYLPCSSYFVVEFSRL